MAAVLMTYTETLPCDCCGSRAHGERVERALCRAGQVELVNRLVDEAKLDVGYDHAAHCVDIPWGVGLRELDWVRRGHAWVCPEHAKEDAQTHG